MKGTIAILTSIAIICFSNNLIAQEKTGITPIISVSKQAKSKIKSGQEIAIFLNSNDSLLIRIIEDAIGIYLDNSGFIVTNRETIEKTLGEKIAEKRKEKTGGAVSALEIGKAVNADSILTGTVIIESGKEESLLTKVSSFQLYDVSSEKILINVLFESKSGMIFSETAQKLVKIIKDCMR